MGKVSGKIREHTVEGHFELKSRVWELSISKKSQIVRELSSTYEQYHFQLQSPATYYIGLRDAADDFLAAPMVNEELGSKHFFLETGQIKHLQLQPSVINKALSRGKFKTAIIWCVYIDNQAPGQLRRPRELHRLHRRVPGRQGRRVHRATV